MLFAAENEYKKFLTCYQLTIYILDYFDKLKLKQRPFVPPVFLMVDETAFLPISHELIKHSIFFKNYAEKDNIKEAAIKGWSTCLEFEKEKYSSIKAKQFLTWREDVFTLMNNLLN